MALDAHAAPRILILRRDNIGDLVCTTPLIADLALEPVLEAAGSPG